MRASLGLLMPHLALVVAGFGVLSLTGQLRGLSPVRWVFAAGLAYMAGVAVVMTLLIGLLAAGVSISLVPFLGVCAVLSVAAVPALGRPSGWPARVRRLRRPGLRDLRSVGLESWGVAVIVALLAWLAILGARALKVAPLSEFDAWLIWTNKAVVLFYYGHFPPEFYTTKIESGGHWDYPILLSMLESLQFRGAGQVVREQAHLVPWALFMGFLPGAAFLVRRATRPLIWAGVLAGLMLLTIVQVSSALADVPMACFLALGALAVGLWIEYGRTSDLAIGGVLLAGAAGMKAEGLVGAFIVLGVALLVSAVAREWRALRQAAVATAGVVVLAVLPWQLWVAAHHIPATTPLSQALNPVYLAKHIERVWPSVHALYDVLSALNMAQFAIPVALALIIVRFRSLTRVAAFYLAVGVLYFLSLVWGYWSSPLDLHFHIGTSVSRIHVGVVFIAAVAVLHLAGEEAPRQSRTPAGDGPPRAAPLAPVAQPLP